MKIKIKPRFYVFIGFLLFVAGFIWYSRVSSPIVQQKNSTVLAAADSSSDTFSLVESKEDTSQTQNDIAVYEPVTISHTVKEGDTLEEIAKTYHADPQTIADYPYNTFGDDFSLTKGQVLIIPNGYINTPPPEIPVAIGSGLFSWPVQDIQGRPARGPITQYAFWWHPGAIDIAVDIGTPIVAAYPGKVISVEKWTTGYGWHVVIEHSGGYTSLYAHMSRLDVAVGQVVNRGTRLGLSGSTGRSTGPHLHFEVKKQGNAVDPMSLLPK